MLFGAMSLLVPIGGNKMLFGAMSLLVPIVGAIALFTFLAVAVWAESRRKEREAYYRCEFRKKLVDAGEMKADHVQDLMRFEHEADMWKYRQSMISGGFITAGVGGGMLLGLRFIDDPAVWMIGYIPLFIGLAMLMYALFFAQRRAPIPPTGAFPTDKGAE